MFLQVIHLLGSDWSIIFMTLVCVCLSLSLCLSLPDQARAFLERGSIQMLSTWQAGHWLSANCDL